MIVYKTTNLVNGKIYVGQDSKNNPEYLGSGVYILNAIKKYGKECFKKEVIDLAVDQEILNLKEEYWISYINTKVPIILLMEELLDTHLLQKLERKLVSNQKNFIIYQK